MNKYTAEEVKRAAGEFPHPYEAKPMLLAYAALLRAKEAEEKRDVVNDPRLGDRIWFSDAEEVVWHRGLDDVLGRHAWKTWAKRQGATLIPRRENP